MRIESFQLDFYFKGLVRPSYLYINICACIYIYIYIYKERYHNYSYHYFSARIGPFEKLRHTAPCPQGSARRSLRVSIVITKKLRRQSKPPLQVEQSEDPDFQLRAVSESADSSQHHIQSFIKPPTI